MPDYKEMYLHLMRETEKSIRILIDAQRECERMYLESIEPVLSVLSLTPPESNQDLAPLKRGAYFSPLGPTYGKSIKTRCFP